MARYFRKFPKANYTLNNYNENYITNLTVRFSLEEKLKNNVIAYYPYIIKDGDTPEILASKIYGSVERHWVILLLNDIIDPQFDWPLPYRAFETYIKDKYAKNASVGQTGFEWANSNIHSYYKVISETVVDSTGTKVTNTKEYEIDATSYAALSTSIDTIDLTDGTTLYVDISKKTKSYYDYEQEINENKKRIKLLNPDLVLDLESQIEEIFLDGAV
jgi:hypothetical protein